MSPNFNSHRIFLWLVGLTVITVTVLIFVPVYYRAKRHMKPSSCQFNQKQIAFAVSQYSADYDGYLPVIVLHPASSTQRNVVLAYGWADAPLPYLLTPHHYQCPRDKNEDDGPYQPWEDGYTDYFLNSRLAGIKEAKVKFPESTVLLADGNDGFDVTDGRYAYPSLPPLWKSNWESPSYLHLNGANYAFLDGHVKWVSGIKSPGVSRPGKNTFTFVP